MHRRFIIALALLLARPAPAQAVGDAGHERRAVVDDARGGTVGDAGHERRAVVDDARGGAVGDAGHERRAVVDDALRAGLPAELLVAKAREGVAKNVPPARILVVVRGLGAALALARTEAQPFAGASPSPSLLRALVEA